MPSVIPEFITPESKSMQLDKNQSTYCLTEIRKALDALSLLGHDMLKAKENPQQEVDSGFVNTALRLAVSVAVDVSKQLQVPLTDPRETTSLLLALREANEKIEALERAQAEAVTPAAVLYAHNRYQELARIWWTKEGLGWTREFAITNSGIELKLSCRISTVGLSFSTKPDDELNEHIAMVDKWKMMGARLLVHPRNFDAEALDTPGTRAALMSVIERTFPSARLISFNSIGLVDSQKNLVKEQYPTLEDAPIAKLHEVCILIPKLEEIAALESKEYVKASQHA